MTPMAQRNDGRNSILRKELRRMEWSMDKLHSNLLTEILSRLPLKNLACCRCVCTTWLRLISAPEFFKLQLSRSSTTGILMCFHNVKRGTIRQDLAMVQEEDSDTGFQVEARTRLLPGVNLPNVKFEMVGSCHGLICLHSQDLEKRDYLYICNPILGEYITIPVAKDEKRSNKYAFGFCASTNQYKVVRTYQLDFYGQDVPKAEIYTLGTGQWRSIGIGPQSMHLASYYFDAFLHSSIHWLAEDGKGDVEDPLHCFDFEREVFSQLPSLPCRTSWDLDLYAKFGVLKDCLFVAFTRSDVVDPEEFEIWVMMEYGKASWTKQFVIGISPNLSCMVDRVDSLMPLAFFNNGKILMLCSETSVACYDTKRERFEKTQMFKTRQNSFAYRYNPCFLSLKDVAGQEKFKKLRHGKRKMSV